MTDRTRRLWLLLALLGAALWSDGEILGQIHSSLRLQPGVVARVNDHLIDRDSIDRTVAGLDARVRRNEDATRWDVLARMIDEELLVQQALDTGAAQSSPEVRAALVRSAITGLNDEIAAEPLSAAELQTYFSGHRAAYATATRLALSTFYFESPAFPELQPAQARAASALALLHEQAPSSRTVVRTNPLSPCLKILSVCRRSPTTWARMPPRLPHACRRSLQRAAAICTRHSVGLCTRAQRRIGPDACQHSRSGTGRCVA